MNEKVLGIITQTTPVSSPLDTLKALVLRNVDRLDYILDQMAGNYDLPEEFVDYVYWVREEQLRSLAEHVPVAFDERLNELRYVHPDGYRYDDGTPVFEHWHDLYGVTDYYPRYDGDRAKRRTEYEAWAADIERQSEVEARFLSIVEDLEDE